jgi:glucose-1-phosphate thymidylyltransferase
VKAVVVAAGYATRLYPLTRTIAKPLLPLAERPMVDYLVDRLEEVTELDAVHVVTNAKFAADFGRWAEASSRHVEIAIHDDGTSSDADRLGPIGDIAFVLDEGGLAGEDVLVSAGDNLFDYSLPEMVAFTQAKGDASSVALLELDDMALVSQYGVVELDAEERIVSFVEKPADPRTNLVATATYFLHRAHAGLVHTYLADGESPDQMGNFIHWLHQRVPVYGYRFEGAWIDIGDSRQLLDADNRLRRAAGLAERGEYTIGTK